MNQTTDILHLDYRAMHNIDMSGTIIKEQQVDTTATVSVVEHHSVKEPSTWAPIMIPTVCSIIVFVLGWLFTRWVKNKDERDEKAGFRNMVLDWIDLALPIEETSVEALKSLSNKIRQSDDMRPVPFAMPQGIPDRLNELSLEKVTDAFTGISHDDAKERNIHLFNIVSGLEYYSKVNAAVVKAYESYNQQITALGDEWNAAYMPFINNLNDSKNLQNYRIAVTGWQTEHLNKKDSISINLKYVGQLSDIADQLKDTDLMPYLNQMMVILKQLQTLCRGFADNFNKTAELLNASMHSIQNAAEYYRNK